MLRCFSPRKRTFITSGTWRTLSPGALLLDQDLTHLTSKQTGCQNETNPHHTHSLSPSDTGELLGNRALRGLGLWKGPCKSSPEYFHGTTVMIESLSNHMPGCFSQELMRSRRVVANVMQLFGKEREDGLA